MESFQALLSLLLTISLCSANAEQKKISEDKKELKEKRDTVSAPYNYDVPQKSFHVPNYPSQPQPKYTNVDQHVVQKVVPLEDSKARQEISVTPIQESAQQFHPTTFHQQFQYSAQQPIAQPQSYKGYADFAFAYPNYESFSQMPIVHYNGDYDKLTSSVINIPSYSYKAAPMYTSYKASPLYGFSAAPYTSHTPAAVTPSYPKYQSVPQSYAASPFSYVSSQNHAPATYYVQKTIVSKPSKIPEYAQGSKGLGKYSSHSSVPVVHHSQNTYDSPSYYTENERPFKPSAYLGASHVDLYNSYQHSGSKLTNPAEYAIPSKTYLPSKESYPTHPQQIEYQIQYVPQQQPSKPHSIGNTYLPPKVISHEVPKEIYITSTTPHPHIPAKQYLPAVEKPVSTYLPAIEKPANTYLPSKHSFSPAAQYHHTQQTQAAVGVPHNSYQQNAYDSAEYQAVVSQSGHK